MNTAKSRRLAKAFSPFHCENHENFSSAEVIRKKESLNDGEGMQYPCTLHFTAKLGILAS